VVTPVDSRGYSYFTIYFTNRLYYTRIHVRWGNARKPITSNISYAEIKIRHPQQRRVSASAPSDQSLKSRDYKTEFQSINLKHKLYKDKWC
jgi:hypothetical protein